MRKSRQTHAPASPSETQRLVKRAARQGVALDAASARALMPLGAIAATRKLDHACRLIHAGSNEDLELGFRDALRRIDMCGGDVEEAIRRMLAGGVEAMEGVPETVQYAADRGIALAPCSIYRHFKTRGRSGTRRYIDKLGAIMDATSALGVDCTQALATQRLARAGEDVERAITQFTAERRRRADRQKVTCSVPVPPRALSARSNALAGCGCPRCRERLAADMKHYISKLITSSFFIDLDREEARAEANLALILAIDTWPGGHFTGWFATCFKRRVQAIYASRSAAERAMLPLDAEGVLLDNNGGRTVPLAEQIPDRTKDVLTIVLLRERVAERALQLRRIRSERGREYTNYSLAKPKSLRLITSEGGTMSSVGAAVQLSLTRKAA